MDKRPVCYEQDYSRMTPQQRSHLRMRLIKAGKPIPPGLESKRGASPADPVRTKPDHITTTCTVIDWAGRQRVYKVLPNGEVVF